MLEPVARHEFLARPAVIDPGDVVGRGARVEESDGRPETRAIVGKNVQPSILTVEAASSPGGGTSDPPWQPPPASVMAGMAIVASAMPTRDAVRIAVASERRIGDLRTAVLPSLHRPGR
jgi:hypothetical protein